MSSREVVGIVRSGYTTMHHLSLSLGSESRHDEAPASPERAGPGLSKGRRGQLSTGRTLESSPIRIAVTRAWARLDAPSFW